LGNTPCNDISKQEISKLQNKILDLINERDKFASAVEMHKRGEESARAREERAKAREELARAKMEQQQKELNELSRLMNSEGLNRNGINEKNKSTQTAQLEKEIVSYKKKLDEVIVDAQEFKAMYHREKSMREAIESRVKELEERIQEGESRDESSVKFQPVSEDVNSAIKQEVGDNENNTSSKDISNPDFIIEIL